MEKLTQDFIEKHIDCDDGIIEIDENGEPII